MSLSACACNAFARASASRGPESVESAGAFIRSAWALINSFIADMSISSASLCRSLLGGAGGPSALPDCMPNRLKAILCTRTYLQRRRTIAPLCLVSPVLRILLVRCPLFLRRVGVRQLPLPHAVDPVAFSHIVGNRVINEAVVLPVGISLTRDSSTSSRFDHFFFPEFDDDLHHFFTMLTGWESPVAISHEGAGVLLLGSEVLSKLVPMLTYTTRNIKPPHQITRLVLRIKTVELRGLNPRARIEILISDSWYSDSPRPRSAQRHTSPRPT